MTQITRRTSFNFAFAAALLLTLAASTNASATTTVRTGTFGDGATYIIEVPSPWNGTLLHDGIRERVS